MKQIKFMVVVSCFVFLALAISPRVMAQTSNEKTVITFSEPFEVLVWALKFFPRALMSLHWWNRSTIEILSESRVKMDCTFSPPSWQSTITA